MLRVLKQIGQPLRTTSQAREPASVIVVPYLPPPEGLIYGKPQCGYPAPTCLRFSQFEKGLLEQFCIFYRLLLSTMSLAFYQPL